MELRFTVLIVRPEGPEVVAKTKELPEAVLLANHYAGREGITGVQVWLDWRSKLHGQPVAMAAITPKKRQ